MEQTKIEMKGESEGGIGGGGLGEEGERKKSEGGV